MFTKLVEALCSLVKFSMLPMAICFQKSLSTVTDEQFSSTKTLQTTHEMSGSVRSSLCVSENNGRMRPLYDLLCVFVSMWVLCLTVVPDCRNIDFLGCVTGAVRQKGRQCMCLLVCRCSRGAATNAYTQYWFY